MREIEFALALFLISVWSRMELRAIDEINWSLSSARGSLINGVSGSLVFGLGDLPALGL